LVGPFEGPDHPRLLRIATLVTTSSSYDLEKEEKHESRTSALCRYNYHYCSRSYAEGRRSGGGIDPRFGGGYFAAAEAVRDFNMKLIEIAQANTMATLNFAQEIAIAKAPTEAAALWSSHARKNFET
jgi:hypothetical protein